LRVSLLAVSLGFLALGLVLMYQAFDIFLHAWGLPGPDNIGYGIAFLVLTFSLGAVFLAFWAYLVAKRFHSEKEGSNASRH